MGIFDISNYIVNTGIIEQVFQCTAKVILLATAPHYKFISYIKSLLRNPQPLFDLPRWQWS